MDFITFLKIFLPFILLALFFFALYLFKDKYVFGMPSSQNANDSSDEQSHTAPPISTDVNEGKYCPSMYGYVIHALFILLSIYIICSSYDKISSYLPLWCDFNGNGMFYVQKSYPVLFIPVIIQTLFTLLAMKISLKIKNAPLDLKKVTTARALRQSRRQRTKRFLYVFLLCALFDMAAYMYIFCMFLEVQHRALIVYFVYALFTLAALSLPFIAKKSL